MNAKNKLSKQVKAGKTAAKEGLRWFYNPVNQPWNAYSIFWVVIMILSFGIVAVAIGAIATEDNETLLRTVAGMAGGIALLTVLGAGFRLYYSEDWKNLLQVNPQDVGKVFKLPVQPPPIPGPPSGPPPARQPDDETPQESADLGKPEPLQPPPPIE